MYFAVIFVCSGLTSLSTLSVTSRRCLVVTGSSMLTFIVLPHCGIRSQTLLPDTTPSHIIRIPERPVLALPENPSAKRGATSTIVNDFGMLRPGIEPSISRSERTLRSSLMLTMLSFDLCLFCMISFVLKRGA